MADEKDDAKGSPPPSDINTEIKSDPDNIPENGYRMFKIMSLPCPYTKSEIEDLVEELCNEEIRKDIENTVVHVNTKNKATAIVTFKTAELARQAKSLIQGSENIHFKVCTLGTFDIKSGKRLNPDGTPIVKKKFEPTSTPASSKTLLCYLCKEPTHKMRDCPQYECNKLNENDDSTLSSTQATKRPASDDAPDPVDKKIRKISEQRSLKLSNLPLTWGRADVVAYLKENTKENEEVFRKIQYIYLEKMHQYGGPNVPKRATGRCHVLFATPELCLKAKDLLQKTTAIIDGRKIWAAFDNGKKPVLWLPSNKPNLYAMKARDKELWGHKQKFAPTFPRFERLPNTQNWKDRQQHYESGYPPTQEKDNWASSHFKNMLLLNQDSDENTDRYGLSADFLESIGVTPPLTSKIFVDCLSNKYDDENEIRKLFSHAGSVTSVAIIGRVNDILKVKVEFDHPVEAVQAITMFHNQEVYGKALKINMDKTHNAYKRFLPAGLKAFGPGLGKDGAPVKNVRNTIELQKAVNMIMNDMATLKIGNENKQGANASSSTSQFNTCRPKFNTNAPAVNDNTQSLATLASSLTNPVANNPLLALSALLNPQANQMLQLLTQQNAGNNSLAGLSMPQPPVMPQPQASTDWNISQPAHVQNTHPGYNMPIAPNMQSQNMQSVPNTQGYNMHGGTNMLATPSSQEVPYVQPYNIQSSVPYMQAYDMQSSVPNIQAVPIVQSGPNVPAGANLPGGPNISGRSHLQGGPNIPSGPHFQGAPNIQSRSHIQGDAENSRNRDECTVVFNFLPPSVTAAALQSKMREVGEVRSAELAGAGRALVAFYSRRDAANCIKIFDRSKVDSQVIEVKHL